MAKKLRWGLLSTAGINRALIGPIRQSGQSELVAVASRSLEKAQAYAQEHGIPRAYGRYEDLLEDPEIDVIYNPLPNTLHCEWTVNAAEAGKHVLCEKPLVVTLDELDRIESAANAHKVTVFEAFMYLHHPQTLQVQEMLRKAKLGKLQLINSWFSFYLPPEQSHNIRLNPDLEGGSLWDVGVYPNSMAITMAQAGPPVEVCAHQIEGETGVDVTMTAQLRFANDVVAQLVSGFRMPFRQGTIIVGDEGMLDIPEPWKPGANAKDSHINFVHRQGGKTTMVTPAIDPYLCEVHAMESCILDGADPIVPLSVSRDFLRSVLAIRESARSGKPVSL